MMRRNIVHFKICQFPKKRRWLYYLLVLFNGGIVSAAFLGVLMNILKRSMRGK
jgi:hypothetical protein